MQSKPKLYLLPSDRKATDYDTNPDVAALWKEWETLSCEHVLRHRYVLDFFSRPHASTDMEALQKKLRECEKELLEFSSSIPFVQDQIQKEKLLQECNSVMSAEARLDQRLTLDRIALLQKESKSPLTRLLFLVGFPAGIATSAKVVFDSPWVIATLTVVAGAIGAAKTYESEMNSAWKKVVKKTCQGCEKTVCPYHEVKTDEKEEGGKTLKLTEVFAVMKCRRTAIHKTRNMGL